MRNKKTRKVKSIQFVKQNQCETRTFTALDYAKLNRFMLSKWTKRTKFESKWLGEEINT